MAGCRKCSCSVSVSVSDFGLSTTSYDVFTTTQCALPRVVLLIYRLLMTGYFLAYQLYLWIDVISIQYYIKMTILSYTVFILYTLIALVNLVVDMCLQRQSRSSPASNVLKGRYMVQWLFYNVTVTWTCIVLVVFWGALYDPAYPDWLFDITCHTLPGVFGVFELTFTATPCRLVHVIYPFIFGISYLTFTLIYWATGHAPIYSILDYSGSPKLSAVSVVSIFVFIFVFHPVMWGLTKLRKRVAERLNCSQGLRGDQYEQIEP
eukprot:XP_011669088.1 PREDICTED: protein rolling stone-like [Strongylocentrotus purpuratus]